MIYFLFGSLSYPFPTNRLINAITIYTLFDEFPFLTLPTLDPNRYATRRSGNLPSYTSPQAGDDVLRHPFQGHPSYLQKVYAKRGFYQSSCGAS